MEEKRFDGSDLLSLDIDGDDYHVIVAISRLTPRAVIVEYNAKFPPPTASLSNITRNTDGPAAAIWELLSRHEMTC